MQLSIVLQARGAFLQLILIYVVICTVPLVVGLYLILSPRRAGNALNDAFAIFPHVEPQQRLKKLLYQGLGVALVLVSLFYIRQIYIGLALPIAHFLKK
jgi:hypothetical protein